MTVGPLEENCYLVIDESTNRAVLIDPGDEPERIPRRRCTHSGATLERVWLTHAHFDHLGALAGVMRAHPVPVYMHPLEAPLHEVAVDSRAALRHSHRGAPPADRELAEGDRVTSGLAGARR